VKTQKHRQRGGDDGELDARNTRLREANGRLREQYEAQWNRAQEMATQSAKFAKELRLCQEREEELENEIGRLKRQTQRDTKQRDYPEMTVPEWHARPSEVKNTPLY